MDDGLIVTTLDARANFGKLLRRVEDEGRSFVIDETGQSARCYSASGIMYVWRFLNRGSSNHWEGIQIKRHL
jgi:hypothetical protein